MLFVVGWTVADRLTRRFVCFFSFFFLSGVPLKQTATLNTEQNGKHR